MNVKDGIAHPGEGRTASRERRGITRREERRAARSLGKEGNTHPEGIGQHASRKGRGTHIQVGGRPYPSWGERAAHSWGRVGRHAVRRRTTAHIQGRAGQHALRGKMATRVKGRGREYAARGKGALRVYGGGGLHSSKGEQGGTQLGREKRASRGRRGITCLGERRAVRSLQMGNGLFGDEG